MTFSLTPENYHLAHVQASNARIPTDRLQQLGTTISDLHYLGVQGPLPARPNRRKLKPAQLHALGAIAVMIFNDPTFFEGLLISRDPSEECRHDCPNRVLIDGDSPPETEVENSEPSDNPLVDAMLAQVRARRVELQG
jgi:hypothetical protein